MKKIKSFKNNNANSSCPHLEEITKSPLTPRGHGARRTTGGSLTSNKGITLIALIITIIVMLILVTVSIQVALNTGLFDSAGKATQNWDTAQDAEQELGSGKVNIDNKTYNSIDEYVKDATIVREPKIGDYVNYIPTPDNYEVEADDSGHTELQTFSTQTGEDSLKWRIMSLGNEEGNILLVADRPTRDELTLYGTAAFEYGPGIIDGLCAALYKNETLGATARSYNFYSQVIVMAGGYSINFLLRYPKDGDTFPYLTEQEFWIPVSYVGYSTLTGSIMMICTANSNPYSRVFLGYKGDSEEGDSLPVLPVIILPDVDLVYDSEKSTSTEIYWNIEEK